MSGSPPQLDPNRSTSQRTPDGLVPAMRAAVRHRGGPHARLDGRRGAAPHATTPGRHLLVAQPRRVLGQRRDVGKHPAGRLGVPRLRRRPPARQTDQTGGACHTGTATVSTRTGCCADSAPRPVRRDTWPRLPCSRWAQSRCSPLPRRCGLAVLHRTWPRTSPPSPWNCPPPSSPAVSSALGWTALAALAAVVATRGAARRAVGALVVLLGVVPAPLLCWDAPRRWAASGAGHHRGGDTGRPRWHGSGLSCGRSAVLLCVAGVLTLVRGIMAGHEQSVRSPQRPPRDPYRCSRRLWRSLDSGADPDRSRTLNLRSVDGRHHDDHGNTVALFLTISWIVVWLASAVAIIAGLNFLTCTLVGLGASVVCAVVAGVMKKAGLGRKAPALAR